MNLDKYIAIKVENVSKKYCKSLKRSMWYGLKDITRNIFGLRSNSLKLRKGEFWALDKVSFGIQQGEMFGIVGPNGAGKTTLLKLLNGIFWPDTGQITIQGRVGALIEVGAGFHPLLTGKQNIYVNAAILGMQKKEVEEKIDAIIAFADIGDYLDTQVKFYSSGMFVRLGFAVAAHCEPEILLIDEVLAVGDKDFQMKCFQKLHEIKKKGTTIVLVSHNEYAIREQTNTCLYIKDGKTKFLGSSEDAITLYIRDVLESRASTPAEITSTTLGVLKKAEILSLRFVDHANKEITYIESGQELQIILECEMYERMANAIFGVHFYDSADFMYCANSYYEDISFENHPLGRVQIRIKINEFHLPSNTYFCSVIISDENVENLIDWHDRAYKLIVGRAKNARGSIKLQTDWKIEKI